MAYEQLWNVFLREYTCTFIIKTGLTHSFLEKGIQLSSRRHLALEGCQWHPIFRNLILPVCQWGLLGNVPGATMPHKSWHQPSLSRVWHHSPLKSFWNFPNFGKCLVFFPEESGRANTVWSNTGVLSAFHTPPITVSSRAFREEAGMEDCFRRKGGLAANILANPKRHQLMVAQSPGALVSARRGLWGGAGSLLECQRKQMSLKWSPDGHADKC